MFLRVRRLATTAFVGGLVAWFLRLLAHSKRPPAEGRWEELRLDEAP